MFKQEQYLIKNSPRHRSTEILSHVNVYKEIHDKKNIKKNKQQINDLTADTKHDLANLYMSTYARTIRQGI